ncbi:MAG: hypothetical protein KGZ58_12945 [Ignavibacteriales bacterium]|nr:hypothetical protein [Ignavibacteriales bacterium]
MINEFFTIDPSKPNPYAWIEIFNPIPDSNVRLFNYTLLGSDTTDTLQRIDTLSRKEYFLKFKALVFSENFFVPFQPPQSHGIQEVYLSLAFSNPIEVSEFVMRPNELFVYTNDTTRLLEHTDIGGDGKAIRVQAVSRMDTLVPLSTVLTFAVIDSSYKTFPFYFSQNSASFQIPSSGEIALVYREDVLVIRSVRISAQGAQIDFNSIDTVYGVHETILDVVRFGNYTPVINPSPGNVSAGYLPEFASLARYSGAYFTGNTRNDFYFETQPTPKFNNPRHHP